MSELIFRRSSSSSIYTSIEKNSKLKNKKVTGHLKRLLHVKICLILGKRTNIFQYHQIWPSTANYKGVFPASNTFFTLRKGPKLTWWGPVAWGSRHPGHAQWVFGVRFQNMALTRLRPWNVVGARDGHSPTIGSTIYPTRRHGANAWLLRTNQAKIWLAKITWTIFFIRLKF